MTILPNVRRPKYKTFRNTVAVVGFLAIGGSCYGCYAYWQHGINERARVEREASVILEQHRKEAEARALADAQAAAAAATAQAQAQAADDALKQKSPLAYYRDAPGIRPLDLDMLALLDRPAVAKIKDAAKGKPYKINIYSDDGKRFNRAKVDLDRDEKDDESWTFHSDWTIERKVSTKDNGTYDDSFYLMKSGWSLVTSPSTPTSTPTPTPSTATATSTANGLRPVDQDMLSLLNRPVEEKLKDGTKGKPYKINLYSDDRAAWNRAKVDLDRDEKWDESWTFKGGSTERKVAPADDENYTEVYVLSGTSWTKK
jgi:hypothetical protein